MKVTQEKLPASQIGLEIEIPADQSKNIYEKVVQNLARSTNIPGFRKGKVPRQILLQRLGSQRVKAAALEELIQDSLKAAVEQEAIESLGNYQLRSDFDELVAKYQPGEPLTFSASVDVPPEVKLGEYKGLKVKAEEIVYNPAKVDEALEEHRAKKAILVPVEDRPAQMGDTAVVDYQGSFADAPAGEDNVINGTQATDFQMELAEGRFIAGLVEGVVGMNPEETKEIPVTFPADYPREDLADKDVIFTLTVKEIKTKELPELDDDFAQEISEFETLAELRASLEKRFQEEAANATNNNIQTAIITELAKTSSVDLPETMVREEVQAMLTQSAMQMSNYGIDIKKMFTPDIVAQMRQRSRPEAMQRLSNSLILKEIAKQESLEASPEALEAKIKEVKQQLGDQAVDEERLKNMVTEEILIDQTLEWLQEQTEVELVPEGSLAETESEAESETPETETEATSESED